MPNLITPPLLPLPPPCRPTCPTSSPSSRASLRTRSKTCRAASQGCGTGVGFEFGARPPEWGGREGGIPWLSVIHPCMCSGAHHTLSVRVQPAHCSQPLRSSSPPYAPPWPPHNERCRPFRFRYNGFALARASAHSIEQLRLQERRDRGGPGAELALAPGSEWLHREEADAVSTIMQWLHSRMEE